MRLVTLYIINFGFDFTGKMRYVQGGMDTMLDVIVAKRSLT